MEIPLSSPDITESEKQAVLDVLNTPYLSLGPRITEFEKTVADFTRVKYSVAMSSGTAVLHTLIRAWGIGEGDYVITTPFSFISTANCILFEGARPIFVDIDKETYNITPRDCENLYLNLPVKTRERTKAIIYVDVFGVPADGKGFELLGKKYGLRIIEDSAEALGSVYLSRKCGSFGDAGIYAFYPNKQITTGEGGMLLTNDSSLDRLARSLRNQGRDNDSDWLKHKRLGYNYRLSELNCALGIAQMKRIENITGKRRKVKKMYDDLFGELFKDGTIFRQRHLKGSDISPFVYVLRLSDSFRQKDRDRLIKSLRKEGINCSDYFSPIHLQPVYKNLGWKIGDMPVTESVSGRTIALPFFNNLKLQQIRFIVEKFKSIVKELQQ